MDNCPEMRDLVIFLCETWDEIDGWAYKYMDGNALNKYPVIQGTKNQGNLRKIGELPYNPENIKKAVDFLLKGE